MGTGITGIMTHEPKSKNYNEGAPKQKSELAGRIEVICGCMFSGKTEELIKRLSSARAAGLKVAVFSPKADTRFSKDILTSHNSNSIPSTAVENANCILSLTGDADVVGIDEAQFLDNQLPEVCDTLANRGVRVILAGLDMDFKGRPFDPIPAIMAIADSISKLQAICVQCGSAASYSFRLVPDETRILPGENETYEPRCRACYHTRF